MRLPPTNKADTDLQRPPREPLFNVPWPITALIGALIATHGLRVLLGLNAAPFALMSGDLAAGRWAGLLTHMFTHANWTHVFFNSVSILAFGPPVARLLGSGARGGLAFFGFFLVCGVISALGYAAVHPQGEWGLVGASGAAFGLVAGAMRLIQGHGRIGSLFSRTVLGMTAFVIIGNAVMGIFGLTPGAGGLLVAWEAHIFGYFAGLFLITPFAWLAGVRNEPHSAITY
jgi:membrane associated rhomboid family serine protease